jgi:diphthamide biosynthesis protein 3
MSIYEEVEIEDMEFDELTLTYSYPCPCGDRFRITLEELHDGEDTAKCPSCTLRITVIYDEDDLPELKLTDDDDDDELDKSSHEEEEEEENDGNINATDEDELTKRLGSVAVSGSAKT